MTTEEAKKLEVSAVLRLGSLRKERKKSMAQVARDLGIPYTTYVNYEKGEREPNSETLIILADYFNCSIDYLIGRSDERIDDSVLDIEATEEGSDFVDLYEKATRKVLGNYLAPELVKKIIRETTLEYCRQVSKQEITD